MADRAETAIAVLVLAAAAFVLVAPVAGRAGAPGVADAAMLSAAGAGLAAFVLAGVETVRAARRKER